MIRQLVKDSIVYGISTILVQGLNVLLIPIYTRVLPPDSYGTLEILTVVTWLVNIIVPLEINQGFARHYGELEGNDEKVQLASTTLWFTVSLYGIFLLLSLFFSGLLSQLLLGSGSWTPVFQIAAVSMAVNGVLLVFLNQLRWHMKPVHYALASIIYAFISAVVALFFLIGLNSGVAGVFYGQIIGAVIGGVYAWFVGRREFSPVFSSRLCLKMLQYSAPLVPSSISVMLANFIDRFAIQFLISLEAVGIYGIGFRVASIVNLLVVGFYSALTPQIYLNYQNESIRRDLERLFRYFLLATLPLVIFISLYSKEIVRVITTPEYYGAWSVIPCLAFSSITMRMYMFAPGLDIAKKTGIIAFINLGSALLNLILTFTLIPRWGIFGAALATWISGSFSFACYMLFNQRFYPVSHNWLHLIGAFFLTVLVIIWGMSISSDINALNIESILYRFILLAVACATLTKLLLRQGRIQWK